MVYVPEPKGLGGQQTGAEGAVSPLTLSQFPSWEARGRTQPSRSEQLGTQTSHHLRWNSTKDSSLPPGG